MIVLMPHCGFLSELSRSVEIGRALVTRGEEVLLATHGGPYVDLLDATGLPWVLVEPHNDAERQERFLRGLLSWGGQELPLYAPGDLRASAEAEAALLREREARLVVTGFTLSAYLSSRLAGVPLATDHGGTFLPPMLEAGLAPVPCNSPKPQLSRLPRGLQRRLANLIPRVLTVQARQINAAADELGVERVPGLMGLMCGDLTMVTDLPEVVGLPAERLARWRPRRTTRVRPGTTFGYTGPLFARFDIPVPDRVREFLAVHDHVVLLSPTSVDEHLLRRLVRSVQDAGAPVLVSSGPHDVSDLEDGRTLVAGVLPNHLVMPQVAAAVTMGGQGSVQTAMASGTPLVGLPFHAEQEFNVAVAERLGCAVRVSPRTAGGPEIGRAVRRLLDEPSFGERARGVKALYDGVDGAGRAADAILEYLAVHQPARA